MNKGRKVGHITSQETRDKIRKALLGRPLSIEHKREISLSLKGRKCSPESIAKRSKTRTGKHTAWLGGKHKEETKRKIGISNRIALRGSVSSLWRGGISNDLYSIDWTNTLKRSIRERDKYICQICSSYGESVHHIDYNKKNSDPKNLLTLCKRCHSKTNFNRKKWLEFLTIS